MAEAQLETISGQSGNCFVRLAAGSQNRQLKALLNFSHRRRGFVRKSVLVIDGRALSDTWGAELAKHPIDEVIGWKFNKDQAQQLLSKVLASPSEAQMHFSAQQYTNTQFLLYASDEATCTDWLSYLGAPLHQAELRVNLDALRHNLAVHRSALKPGAALAVMVKANAYGAGLVETARALEGAGVEYLAVAYADEGMQLRQAGIRCPIMVLNTEPNALKHFVWWQLEPVVYSFPILERLADFLVRTESRLAIHLEFNTGMNRLGLGFEEAHQIGKKLSQQPNIRVATTFAHLAASGDAVHDAFTERQIQQFALAHAELERTLGYPVKKHLLNSGGVARFPQYDMDMVRLGIGVYGADATGILQPDLQVVMTLQAQVAQVRTVGEGETVGYSRAGEVPAGSKVATLGIGYADGLPRALGNGRHEVLINGQMAPIVGNVCMDMCMVDVSGIEGVEAGTAAIVFGPNPSVEAVAEQLHTIPYEVFTSVGQRVRRVYTETS